MPTTVILYTFIFLMGLVMGGFVNFCADRFMEEKVDFRKKRSCVKCGAELQWRDSIPVLSFLLLKGRCRSCGAKVSKRYPLVELACGVLFVIVFMANGRNLQSICYCLMTSAFLVISIVDFCTFEIPLPCNLFLGVVGILVCVFDLSDLWNHVIGFFAISVALYLLFVLSKGGAIGGGDVKLMAVAGLILGWKLVILAFFLGCIIGSVCHVIRMKVSNAEKVLAMGPYLCAGLWICALWGDRMIAWYFAQLVR